MRVEGDEDYVDDGEDIWCPECDGDGVIYGEGEDGEGEDGEEVEEECPECAGSGWNEGEPPVITE